MTILFSDMLQTFLSFFHLLLFFTYVHLARVKATNRINKRERKRISIYYNKILISYENINFNLLFDEISIG